MSSEIVPSKFSGVHLDLPEIEDVRSWARETFALPGEDPVDAVLADHVRQIEERRTAFAVLSQIACVGDFGLEGVPSLEHAERRVVERSWRRALKSVYGLMTAEDRIEWDRVLERGFQVVDESGSIRTGEYIGYNWTKVPITFDESAVRATVSDLIERQGELFARRVQSVFRALSPRHKTNLDIGFGRRFILAHVNEYGHGYYADALDDLRCVILTCAGMRTDSLGYRSRVACWLRNISEDPGVWHEFDGGLWRARRYNGAETVHIEIAEEMARRLNIILASTGEKVLVGPRPRPKKSAKKVDLTERVLSAKIREMLSDIDGMSEWDDNEDSRRAAIIAEAFGYRERDDRDAARACEVVAGIGSFPDVVANQLYVTPEAMADAVAVAARKISSGPFLEPSFGTGSIVRGLRRTDPAGRRRTPVVGIEVSPTLYRARQGDWMQAICGDFLSISPKDVSHVDCVVMNPPFSGGRAIAHVEHAANFAGKIVAILGEGDAAKIAIPGWTKRVGDPMSFPRVSIKVSIVVLERQ